MEKLQKCPLKTKDDREHFLNAEFSTIFTDKVGKMQFPLLKQKNITPWNIIRAFPRTTASGREKTIKSARETVFCL